MIELLLSHSASGFAMVKQFSVDSQICCRGTQTTFTKTRHQQHESRANETGEREETFVCMRLLLPFDCFRAPDWPGSTTGLLPYLMVSRQI